MEPGHRRTIIARTAAGLGTLCGANALLAVTTGGGSLLDLTPHGWGIGGILLVLIPYARHPSAARWADLRQARGCSKLVYPCHDQSL